MSASQRTGDPFGPHNLAYGVFSTPGTAPRVGVRFRDHVLDLSSANPALAAVWRTPSLNAFLALGRAAWADTRGWLGGFLADPERAAPHLIALAEVTLHLPVQVRDYVDFYASEHHASNVGRIFRPGTEPLTPNWRHMPLGYHGRAGSIVVSGTDIVRPSGPVRPATTDAAPGFGPSQQLDIEVEVGFVLGGTSRLGEPVPVSAAQEHLFGVVLVNDWSARDIQGWEYIPLGPFLGKSFATTMSAWVVPWDALSAARVPLPPRVGQPLPYLRGKTLPYLHGEVFGLDIDCVVEWNGLVVSRPRYRAMHWSPTQMLAHLTVNGASIHPGDLFASGTISGPEPSTWGSLLEITWNGRDPVRLADGEERTFLADEDRIVLRASAPGPDGLRVGLGECAGTIRSSSARSSLALPVE